MSANVITPVSLTINVHIIKIINQQIIYKQIKMSTFNRKYKERNSKIPHMHKPKYKYHSHTTKRSLALTFLPWLPDRYEGPAVSSDAARYTLFCWTETVVQLSSGFIINLCCVRLYYWN